MEIEINMTCISDHCPKCHSSTEFVEDIGDVEIPSTLEILFECTCGLKYVRKIKLEVVEPCIHCMDAPEGGTCIYCGAGG